MAKKTNSPKRFAETVTKKKIIHNNSDTKSPTHTSPAKSPSSEPKSQTPKASAKTPKKSATTPKKNAKTTKKSVQTPTATEAETIDTESTTDDVASGAQLEEIRAAIANGPTKEGWGALLSVFKSWDTKAAEYDAGLQYAMEHIKNWPDALRTFTYQQGDEHAPWLPLCRGMTLQGKSLPDDLSAMLQQHSFAHLAFFGPFGASLPLKSLKEAKELRSLHLEGYTRASRLLRRCPLLRRSHSSNAQRQPGSLKKTSRGI